MIFRNRRQFLSIDAYHHIGGTRYNKITVRNAETTEFKHKYYDHDKFAYKSDAINFNMNGESIISSKSQKKIVSVRAGTSTYLAVATIKSKTATANSHVSYQLARFGKYVHDTSRVSFNVDRIFSYDDQNLKTFIPRGANTDIYADEGGGENGGSGGLTITQYWS